MYEIRGSSVDGDLLSTYVIGDGDKEGPGEASTGGQSTASAVRHKAENLCSPTLATYLHVINLSALVPCSVIYLSPSDR